MTGSLSTTYRDSDSGRRRKTEIVFAGLVFLVNSILKASIIRMS
jgi:hypothetical protein